MFLLQTTRLSVLLFCLHASVLGCQFGSSRPEPTDKQTAAEADILYSGCDEVSAGPVCILFRDNNEERLIQLWVEAPIQTKVTISGKAIAVVKEKPRDGGVLYQLRIDSLPTKVVVDLLKENSASRWSMAIQERKKPDWFVEAKSHLRKRNRKLAKEILMKHTQTAGELWQARIHGQLARIAFAEEQFAEAQKLFEKAIRGHIRQGNLSALCKDANSLAFVLILWQRQFSRARIVLENARVPRGHADSIFFIEYEKGHLALEQGDLRNALNHFKRAEATAKRVDFSKRVLAGERIASTLVYIGRRIEAFDILDQLIKEIGSAHPCSLASLVSQSGWVALLLAQANEGPANAAVGLILRAQRLYREHNCQRRQSIMIGLRVDLAKAYLLLNQPDTAAQQLAVIRQSGIPLTPKWKLWILELDAILALTNQNYEEAYRLYQELVTRAERILKPELTRRAIVGCGRALVGLQRYQNALTLYEKAEFFSRRSALRVALGDGRAAFLSQHFQAVQEHVALLLRLGKTEKAMQVARRARAQALESINQANWVQNLTVANRKEWEQAISAYRQAEDQLNAKAARDWELSEHHWKLVAQRRKHERANVKQLLDGVLSFSPVQKNGKLPRVKVGELNLLFFPLKDRWQGFAQDSQGVVSHELPNVCGDRWKENGSKLLAPFRKQIDRNQRLRILTLGCLANSDFHELPFDGDVLVAKKQVVYGLDLSTSVENGGASQRKRALFVIDPEINLPHARLELSSVSQLKQAGFEIDQYIGKAARSAAIKKELPNIQIFHFSGHSEMKGQFGWESRLRLADSRSLRPGDILISPSVPRSVVLLSCDSGRDTGYPISSIGLAQSFVAAGSKAVLATNRPLDDSLGLAISSRLYNNFTTLVDSAHRAIREVKNQKPNSDWAALRILVP